MFKKIKIIIQITIVVLIIISFGYYIYSDYQKSKTLKDTKSETIEQISNLDFTNQTDQDIKQETIGEYKESFNTQAEIFINDSENPKSFWALIEIAQIKELFEDYDGAKQALLWAIDLEPKSYLANGNLAHLYFRHYNDFAKAEEFFLKAIESDSVQVATYYYDLHEIYRYFYKQDTGLAEDILKQGIEKYPKEIDLMFSLARYYEDMNRKDEAKEYYIKILEINPDSQIAKQKLEDI